MTTAELARLVCRHTSVTDLASLEPGKAMDLVHAVNHGIQTFFHYAPDHLSRATVSCRVDPPEMVQIDVTGGNAEFSGLPYARGLRGCSIQIEGDAALNEIVGPDRLLHAYAGPSGSRQATVWHDSVAALDFQIESFVGHPIVMETRKQILPIASRDLSLVSEGNLGGTGEFPTHYLLEHVGGSVDAEEDAVFQIRLLPRPVSGCTLKIEAQVLPLVYRIADLTEPRRLPIAPAHCSRLLVPLVEECLLGSALWSNPDAIPQVARMAEEAKRSIEALPRFARSSRRVRTKPGW